MLGLSTPSRSTHTKDAACLGETFIFWQAGLDFEQPAAPCWERYLLTLQTDIPKMCQSRPPPCLKDGCWQTKESEAYISGNCIIHYRSCIKVLSMCSEVTTAQQLGLLPWATSDKSSSFGARSCKYAISNKTKKHKLILLPSSCRCRLSKGKQQ